MRNRYLAAAVSLAAFACAAAAPTAASAKQAAATATGTQYCQAGVAYSAYCTCPPGTVLKGYCTSPAAKTGALKVTVKSKQSGNTLILNFDVLNSNSFAIASSSGSKSAAGKLCVAIPKGLGYESSSPKATISKGKVCFALGTIKAKGSKHFSLKFRVLAGTNRKITIHATVAGTSIKTGTKAITVKVTHHGKTSATKVTG